MSWDLLQTWSCCPEKKRGDLQGSPEEWLPSSTSTMVYSCTRGRRLDRKRGVGGDRSQVQSLGTVILAVVTAIGVLLAAQAGSVLPRI